MSTTEAEEDEFHTCASGQSSAHHANGGVRTPGNEGLNLGFSPAISSPAANSTNRAGEGYLVAKLMAWLRARGFDVSSHLPAAFEVDELSRQQQSVDTASARYANSRNVAAKSPGACLNPDAECSEDARDSFNKDQYVCGLRHDMYQNLCKNARHMLHNRPDGTTPTQPSAEDGHHDLPADMACRLREDDLGRLIAYVIRVMGVLHHASLLTLAGRDCCVDPTERARVSIAGRKAILPQAPKRADPATTVSLPQSYITPMDSNDQDSAVSAVMPQSVTSQEITSITTLVSHSTVTSKTEINWTTGNKITSSYHVEPDDPTATRAGFGEQNMRASPDYVTSQTPDTPASRRASRTFSASRAHVESYPPSNPSVVSSQSSITSFPALRKRHCTNDWLTPPAATPGTRERDKSNLYNLGVDAHTGPGAFFSLPSDTERPLATPTIVPNVTIFGEPGFEPAGADGLDGAMHKLGTSIGSSTGRRRTHHVLHPESAVASSSVLRKLRRGSAQLEYALGVAFGVPGYGQQPHQPQQGRRASSADVMRAILESSSAHHGQTDSNGGHQEARAMTGIAVSRPGDTCFEDGRPHMCSDERLSSSYGSHQQGPYIRACGPRLRNCDGADCHCFPKLYKTPHRFMKPRPMLS